MSDDVAAAREGVGPMDIKITPLDIRHKEFKRGLRGYSESEVDEFLDEVANEYERLYKAHQELLERAEALDEKVAGYKRIEDALQKTLVTAQTSAEEVKQNASKAAQLMLHEAELKARQLMNAAYTDKQAVEQATAKLRSIEKEFRFKFQQMLNAYLKQSEETQSEPVGSTERSETQAHLERQAEAIRAAIVREERETEPAGAAETKPAGAATETKPAVVATKTDEKDDQKASENPPSASAATPRVVLGEGDDLLADVDTGVIENEFKW